MYDHAKGMLDLVTVGGAPDDSPVLAGQVGRLQSVQPCVGEVHAVVLVVQRQSVDPLNAVRDQPHWGLSVQLGAADVRFLPPVAPVHEPEWHGE